MPWLPVTVALTISTTMACAREARPTRVLVDANPVRVEIQGQGSVRSQALAFECTSLDRTCRAENFRDAWTDLVAEAAPGWQFVGWQELRAPGDRWAPCGPLYRATFAKLEGSAPRVIGKQTR